MNYIDESVMQDVIKFEGKWWTPSIENPVPGTLTIDPQGRAELILEVPFDENIFNKQIDIILGVSSSSWHYGEKITILGCNLMECGGYSKGETSKKLLKSVKIDKILIGTHIYDVNETKVDWLRIYYSYLNSWLEVSGISILIDKNDVERTLRVEYASPDTIRFKIDKDITMTFLFKWTTSRSSLHEVCLQERVWLEIDSADKKDLEYYLELMWRVSDFLSMIIGENVYPLIIEGKLEDSEKPERFTVYFGNNSMKPLKERPPREPIPFHKVESKLDGLFKTWFEKIDLLQPVYNLYLSSIYNPRMYLEQRFLALVQGLESYHRRTRHGKDRYLPDDLYNEILEEFGEFIHRLRENGKITDDLEDNLMNKLRWGNEYTLRKRLKELINEIQELLQITMDNQIKTFIDRLVKYRNYLTHYDPQQDRDRLDYRELINLVEKVRLILKTFLLKEMGLDIEIIREHIIDSMESVNRDREHHSPAH